MTKNRAAKARQQQKRAQKRAAKTKRRESIIRAASSPPAVIVWSKDPDDVDIGRLRLPDRRLMQREMLRMFDALDSSPVSDAQEYVYDAWEAPSDAEAVRLARRALDVSEDCAEAYCVLAQRGARDLASAAELYRRGVEAGARALGVETFEQDAGYFWGLLETRPYMRALWGLAECSWALGERDQAARQARELLRLNPNDNQGVRHTLLAWLIELDRDDDAVALLAEYERDSYAGWLYGRALLAFRAAGATESACGALSAAVEANRHVPPLLLATKAMPASLPDYMTFGDETEAVIMVAAYANAWRRTPGALAWLAQSL
jgi:tetratricopeptide (TPR) repeat protein